MASSNRHWPSLFKSKHCSNHHHHHQWQHTIATSSPSSLPNACQRPPYSSGPGSEERTPEPKPRWNPKPEQIRILEAIFNSGMVNPPRDEIRKIRAQLQEYGQVGDANVFYWFQNRKSRSKHKLRHLQASRQAEATTRGGGGAGTNNTNNLSSPSGAGGSCAPVSIVVSPASAAPSNSSSSSERSTGSGASDRNAFASSTALGVGLARNTTLLDVANVPATSMVNHATYLHHGEPLPTGGGEPFSFLQLHQGYPLPADDMSAFVAGIPDPSLELFSGLRAAELVGQNHHHGCVKSSRNMDALATDKKMQLHLQQNGVYGTPTAAESTAMTTTAIETTAAASPISEIHAGKPGAGAGPSGSSGCSGGTAAPATMTRLVAFINGMIFEVAEPGLINVREVFGDEAVLFHANGNPVLIDEWGVTLEPLQHGASYFLV